MPMSCRKVGGWLDIRFRCNGNGNRLVYRITERIYKVENEIVNVLISTYNGEAYIAEQIDSILAQTYSPVRIYVRDDGSKDQTLQVLKGYGDKIKVLRGKNVGYGRSFLALLKKAEEGSYWAFCDQDDVWEPHKLEKAVAKLRRMPKDKPCMYFHNFSITDEKLKVQSLYHNRLPGYCFSMAITECLHLGFATVMNRELRQLMLRADMKHISTHDWWAELIAMEFGRIYTDDYVGAKHRRIDASVSSSNLSTRIRWFKKALKGNAEICNMTSMFLKEFGNEMKPEDRRVMEWFVSDHYSLSKSLHKAFYGHRWRSSLSSELVVRFLMLIGRI